MANIDLASNSALLSVADKLDTQNVLLAAMSANDGALPITSWGAVQSIVRMGLAPKIFSIGDTFTCSHEEFGELTWNIVGIDHDTPADKSKKHSITLMLTSPLLRLPFSEPEALFYCGDEIPAGTYYFTIPGSKSYSFTTTQSHYNPNIIFFDNKTKNVIIYSDPTYSSISETLSTTTGTSGTFLGKADGTTLNSSARILYGSNNWISSDIRQWLSSDKGEGLWWEYTEDKGVLNRPPSFASRAGFLNKIDPEFAAVLGAVVKPTNSLTQNGVETEDKVFLPSITELYGSYLKSGTEGKPYAYFADYSDIGYPSDDPDANRIIQNSYGFGESYLLRSLTKEKEGYIWRIESAGSISTHLTVNSSSSIVPMCCIV